MSLGMHESQSRMWENIVGRSRPFCAWLHPRLAEWLPGTVDGLDATGLYRAVNSVQPSLIRTEADETTYNLHIILRFELELALIEGTLSVDDLPAAWDAGMRATAGHRGPDRRRRACCRTCTGAAGLFGYFPTYTLGNLIASQLLERIVEDLADLDEQLAARRVRAAARVAAASTSTGTGASTRRASCCTGSPATTSA